MTSRPLSCEDVPYLLRLLTPANRLICVLSLRYGLRVGDVCALPTSALAPKMTVHEQKTGKRRRISLPSALLSELRAQAGKRWVFEGRRSAEHHRTRQAVWSDVRRAARALRLDSGISPHSLRKSYAIAAYERYGDLRKVQKLLNHDRVDTTMLYVFSDKISTRKH